jgi:mRNA deadenylase 3'-5' endonuclease subunit Ccr4
MASITLPSQTEGISVATYNCLADEYLSYLTNLNLEQTTYTAQPQFQDRRVSDCVKRLQLLKAEVICVQELSSSVSRAFIDQMHRCGYTVVYEQFDEKKPDGVATCYLSSKFRDARKEVLSYSDKTGRKALFLHLQTRSGAVVDICNTHLQGGSNNKTVADAQIRLLVQKIDQIAVPVILCMDGNFTPADPRFQELANHRLQDSLNGQNFCTSMNGMASLRLDYIWYSNPLVPISSSVDGDLSRFLTSQEPSDHIPVTATFSLPIPATSPSHLNLRNNFPGTDANPSFRRKIFGAFNDFMLRLNIDQASYDKHAASFEAMIDKANLEDQKNKGQFLPSLVKEIAFHSPHWSQAKILLDSCNPNSAGSVSYHNNQPFNNAPSFRFKIFEEFNNVFFRAGIVSPEIYRILASQFELLLASAATGASQGGHFLTILEQSIYTDIPNGMAKDLYLGALKAFTPAISSVAAPKQPVLPPETVITIKCKEVPSGVRLFIRGSDAGLGWGSKDGVELTRLDQETYEFKPKVPFSGKLEFKLLLNNDETMWEGGVNHTVEPGKRVEIHPTFAALNKTVIEVNFPLPAGQTLYVSGSGSFLGDWSKQVPMTTTDNRTWRLIVEGEFTAVEYKLRSDDGRWEIGPNRKADHGKKNEVATAPEF